MLRMRNISKTYRTEHVETRALHYFSIEVKAGEFVAMTGPSGSGKTTFLNVAGLLETFDSGTYKLDGRDVSGLSDDALKTVGLGSRATHMPSQLSGGQQQRVAIARALAGEPSFLLADEPTGNLDSIMARQIMDLLGEINVMGTTIVLVTHDPELSRRAHRNVHMSDGEISKASTQAAVPAPCAIAAQ